MEAVTSDREVTPLLLHGSEASNMIGQKTVLSSPAGHECPRAVHVSCKKISVVECRIMSSIGIKKRRKQTFFCHHCDQELSRVCYWKHRRSYYNAETQTWAKKKTSTDTQCRTKIQKRAPSDCTEIWSESSSSEEDVCEEGIFFA